MLMPGGPGGREKCCVRLSAPVTTPPRGESTLGRAARRPSSGWKKRPLSLAHEVLVARLPVGPKNVVPPLKVGVSRRALPFAFPKALLLGKRRILPGVLEDIRSASAVPAKGLLSSPGRHADRGNGDRLQIGPRVRVETAAPAIRRGGRRPRKGQRTSEGGTAPDGQPLPGQLPSRGSGEKECVLTFQQQAEIWWGVTKKAVAGALGLQSLESKRLARSVNGREHVSYWKASRRLRGKICSMDLRLFFWRSASPFSEKKKRRLSTFRKSVADRAWEKGGGRQCELFLSRAIGVWPPGKGGLLLSAAEGY